MTHAQMISLDEAELYDALFPLETGYLDFVDRELAGAETILELGSGTGRLAVPLATRGYTITGVDMNPAYVNAAKKKAQSAKVATRCHFSVGDFAKHQTDSKFDAAFLSSNTLSLVASPEDRFEAFQRLGECLAPGARLIVIMVNTARLLQNGPHREARRYAKLSDQTEAYQIEIRHYDPLESQWCGTNTLELLHPDGRCTRSVSDICHAAVLTSELEYLSDQAGLSLEKIFGDFNRSALSLASPRAIYIFTKRS